MMIVTDTYYLKKPVVINGITYSYLIVFMDDCSRYVVSWRLQQTRAAAEASAALE